MKADLTKTSARLRLVAVFGAATLVVLATPGVAQASGGISPDPTPTVVATPAPAVSGPQNVVGADADATAGPGGAGGIDRLTNILSAQDAGGKSGATVNTGGVQSNGNAAKTDGGSATQSMVAAPQWRAQSNAATLPGG
jgi:hypothetical protein